MNKVAFTFFTLLWLLPLSANCLKLHEAIEIALDQNPSIRAAAYGLQIAQDDVGIAKSPYYPTLGVFASYYRFQAHIFLPDFPLLGPLNTTIPTIVGPTNDWNLGVRSQYIVYDSGERRAKLDVARAQRNATFYDAEAVNQEIALNVSLAFYTLLSNIKIKEVALRQHERAENHLQIVKHRRQAGAVPLADLYRAEVQVANAKQDIIRALAEIEIGKGNLNIAMGLAPETCVEICDESEPLTAPSEKTLNNAFENAAMQRPELKASVERISAAQSHIQEAKSAFGPRIVADGSYGRRDNEFFPRDPEWKIGLSAEWSIFEGYRSSYNLCKAKSQRMQEVAQYDRLFLQVRQDVWNAFQRLKEALSLIDNVKVQVRDAQEGLRLTEKRYQNGVSILSDLLDSQTALTKAEADDVNAYWNYSIAFAKFLWSQGICLE